MRAHTLSVSHVFTVPLPDFLTVYKIKVGDLPTGIVASFHHTGFVMNSSCLLAGLFLSPDSKSLEGGTCV